VAGLKILHVEEIEITSWNITIIGMLLSAVKVKMQTASC
jgi:hypothetical protein